MIQRRLQRFEPLGLELRFKCGGSPWTSCHMGIKSLPKGRIRGPYQGPIAQNYNWLCGQSMRSTRPLECRD